MMKIASQKSRMIILATILFCTISPALAADPVSVLLADNPIDCLSLESIFVDGDGYVLIDGRNNRGRVKLVSDDGEIQAGMLSTLPLPNAASLPSDILPSPWGLDRVVATDDAFWAAPASWAGALAEEFDRQTGEFIERLRDVGLKVSGMVVGPDGDAWAVGRRILVNVSSEQGESIDCGGMLSHIDGISGHPMGFVILEQPWVIFMEKSGITRWRISTEEIVEGYLSPFDIASGPDGTIALCCVVCDLSDEENHSEYFSLREESLSRDDEEVLFAVEDALRSNLGIGFTIILLDPEGNVTDAIEINGAPVACDVDDAGRVHVVIQDESGWSVSMLDPGLDEGFELFRIPYGTPAMITPHRLASGPDGALYWDDVIPGESEGSWGIGSLMPTSGGMFSLGGSESGVDWIYTEPTGDFIRLATSLAVGPDGSVWAGSQEFPFEILSGEEPLEFEIDEAPYTSTLMVIDRDGNIVRNRDASEIIPGTPVASEVLPFNDSMLTAWSGRIEGEPLGVLREDFSWTPATASGIPAPIANARIGELSDGLVGWFSLPQSQDSEARWLEIQPDLAGSSEIPRLQTIRARFLESDPSTDTIWATIDDGEIYQLNANDLRVTGIWHNRLPSGAPGHPIDDAEKVADGLAILDREHRAIMLLEPDAFEPPALVSEADVADALRVIRSAMWDWKNTYGDFPQPSPGLLDTIMSYNDREIVRRAFLGGQFFHYRPSETGFNFIAWISTAEQPVLICDQSTYEAVY